MTPADALIIVQAKRGQWPASLLMAFIQQESAFNEMAFRYDRNGGSYGLMQLDVPTARDRGFKDSPLKLYDPEINITYGVLQLDWIADYLRKRGAFGAQALIAAYNEGVGNVMRGNPDPAYVGNVMAWRRDWQVKLGEGVT